MKICTNLAFYVSFYALLALPCQTARVHQLSHPHRSKSWDTLALANLCNALQIQAGRLYSNGITGKELI